MKHEIHSYACDGYYYNYFYYSVLYMSNNSNMPHVFLLFYFFGLYIVQYAYIPSSSCSNVLLYNIF